MDRRRLEQQLEVLRAAGSLTSFAEVEASARLTEGTQNAAAVYEQAFAAFVPPAVEANVPLFGRTELPARGASWAEPICRAVADCLGSNVECLSLLRKAAEIGDCHYRRELRELLPDAAGLRACAKLLRLNTLFQGHHGDPNGALLSVRDGLRLADSLRRGPILLSHLVRMGLYREALKGLEWALNVTDFTDRQLTELDEMLVASARTLDLTEAMVGERGYMVETYDDPPDFHGPIFHSPLLRLAYVRRIGLMDSLDYMVEAIEASKLAGAQRLGRFREMEKKAGRRSFLHPTIKMVSRLTSRLVEIELCVQTRLGLTRTVLALERYRRMTGKVPENLEELVPQYVEQVSIDLSDDQLIRYQPTQSGYLLCRMDTGGQDNGAEEWNEENLGTRYDLCFLVKR